MDPARDDTIFAMRTQGQTLDAIGAGYGLTRERVRQILKKRFGVVGIRMRPPKPPKRKRIVKVGFFVCSKCDTPFTLSGPALISQRHNIRLKNTTGSWCPACRALRVKGPQEVQCVKCGVAFMVSGQRAYGGRYYLRRGLIRGFRCPNCRQVRGPHVTECSICGGKGMIRRGYCNTHYERWRQHGDPNHVTRSYVKAKSA